MQICSVASVYVTCVFDRGIIVSARLASLSSSVTADLLGFSYTAVSGVYSKRSKKQKTSREWQFCRRTRLVDETGENGEWPDWLKLTKRLQLLK